MCSRHSRVSSLGYSYISLKPSVLGLRDGHRRGHLGRLLLGAGAGQRLQGGVLFSHQDINLFQTLPGLAQLVGGMGNGGLHLTAQAVKLPLHPLDPLLHLAAQLAGLLLGLILNLLGPAVSLQLHSGGALLHGGVGSGVRLQSRHAAAGGLQLAPHPSQLLPGAFGLGLAGGQALAQFLQLGPQLLVFSGQGVEPLALLAELLALPLPGLLSLGKLLLKLLRLLLMLLKLLL